MEGEAEQQTHPTLRQHRNTDKEITLDAGQTYMAASRRDPVSRDRYRDGQEPHERREFSDTEPRKSSPSLGIRVPDRAEKSGGENFVREKATVRRDKERKGSRERERRRSRSPRRHRSRSRQRSPKPRHGEERESRRRDRSGSQHRSGAKKYPFVTSPDGRGYKEARSSRLERRSDRKHHHSDRDDTVELFPEFDDRRATKEKSSRYRYDKGDRERSQSPRRDRRAEKYSHYSKRSKRERSRDSDREDHHSHRKSKRYHSSHRRSRVGGEDDYQSRGGSTEDRYSSRRFERSHRSERSPHKRRHSKRRDEGEKRQRRDYSDDDYPSGKSRGRRERDRSSNSPDRRRGRQRRSPSMPDTQPIQSVLDDRDTRGRSISTIDDSRSGGGRGRGGFDRGGRRGHSYHQPPPPGPPHIDTRFSATPQYGTLAGSFHGSPPHSASPYGSQWGGSPQAAYYHAAPAHAYAQTPPRQHSYPQPSHAQSGFYQQPYGPSPTHSAYATPPAYRGGHVPVRGGYSGQPDRRFSSGSMAGSPTYSGSSSANIQSSSGTRGRGHFQNLQWTAGGGTRGGKQPEAGNSHSHQSSREASVQSTGPPPPPPSAPKEPAPPPPDDPPPFRHSKSFRDEPQAFEVPRKDSTASGESPSESKEGPKFSFAFKGKSASQPAAAKPVADLTQKMKEPPTVPRKDPAPEPFKKPQSVSSRDTPLPQKPRPDHRERSRHDRFDDRRGDTRSKYDHRPDPRDDRPGDFKSRRGPEREFERPLEPPREREKPKGPKMIIIKRKIKRRKPRPQLTADLKASKSVYYRKQGNESVIGSGTYGKVYKALHVYKNELVALKKIRMEGEKDGFPVTAVREMKLLQTLRHENIVRFKETMVESNDCYMVFEYLSHDLTGLLNHPTFKLEHAHKKHLCFQLFQALEYLHRRGVLHRDLKAANILVSNTGVLKLADFGLARFYEKRHKYHYTNRVITIWYRSPELLLGETQYGPAVDIWSAACVLIEIFTRHAIFPGDGSEINQIEKIYNLMGTPTRRQWPGIADMAWFELLKPREARANLFAEKYKERLSPAAFDMIATMLRYDPDKRPSAKEALEHAYFTSEEPEMKQVTELKDVKGDWHEFESKALRKANERKQREALAAEREKSKRRASSAVAADRDQREVKKVKSEAASASDRDTVMAEDDKAEKLERSDIVPIPSRPGPESPEPGEERE